MLTFILGNALGSCQVPIDLETQMFHRGSWIFDELRGFKILSFQPCPLSRLVSSHARVVFFNGTFGN